MSSCTAALLNAAVLASVVGCERAPAARAAPPVYVDSVVAPEIALARFRAGLREAGGFTDGRASRERLVRDLVRALERADTAALVRLMLDRAEFAWLYYPTTPEARPPYDLEPALMWFLLDGRSRQGLAALLAERGGRPLGYLSHRCEAARQEGDNTVWAPCVLRRLQAPGDTIVERLFGPIIERGGEFKLVSYANTL